MNSVSFPLDRIRRLCREAGVVRAYLFGSALTSEFQRDSDVDVIVETDPNRPPGILRLGGLQMDLSELLGRNVHMTLLGGVPEHERAGILARARRLDG